MATGPTRAEEWARCDQPLERRVCGAYRPLVAESLSWQDAFDERVGRVAAAGLGVDEQATGSPARRKGRCESSVATALVAAYRSTLHHVFAGGAPTVALKTVEGRSVQTVTSHLYVHVMMPPCRLRRPWSLLCHLCGWPDRQLVNELVEALDVGPNPADDPHTWDKQLPRRQAPLV